MVLGTGLSISEVNKELELLAEAEVCQGGSIHRL